MVLISIYVGIFDVIATAELSDKISFSRETFYSYYLNAVGKYVKNFN